MEVFHVLLYALVAAIFSVYAFFKYKFSYWQRHGVPYIEPKIPTGNFETVGRRLHSSQLMAKYYKELKGSAPFAGLYMFIRPIALILDLDLMKYILIRDFNYFTDRGLYYNEKDDPLSAHLLSLDGQRWKTLRAKLTPTFTSGKMKLMFPTIIEIGERFQKVVKEEILGPDVEVEVRELLARFSTDVIGTVAFGIECNSLKDPNTQFRLMSKKAFENPRNSVLKQLFIVSYRDFARKLRIRQTHQDVSDFFLQVVRDTIEYRKKNNIERNDFMNLLMQLQNDDSDGGRLTVHQIAAQAFLFFLAGFETSSTTMSYALYELSLHQDIQDKARDEINRVIQKHGGQFTYEAMMDMHYLDQVIHESLRKYPPGANLLRKTVADYQVPESKVVLKKGTTIWVPVYAIHHDPDIYPDPEKFDPERFLPENVQKRHPCSFLGFGDGPRNCIGARFGLMQSRIGLVTILRHFRVTPSPKTRIPLTFSPRRLILTPEGGLWLHLEPVK